MVSRRVVVGSGLTVLTGAAALHIAGRDDDVLRLIGARPRPIADSGDVAVLRTAAQEQASLIAAVEGLSGDRDVDDLVAVLREQSDALGTAPSPATNGERPATNATEVAQFVAAAARRRERDALAAVSPELGRVLASLAAGQAQVARSLGRLA